MINKFGKYSLAILSILIGYAGLYLDGLLTWALLIYAFMIIPLLELFVEGSRKNLTKEEEQEYLNSKFFDVLVYAVVPLQYGLLVLFLITIQRDLLWWEVLGKTVTFGLCCGVFGINVAHELGHRIKKYEQWMAKALLLTTQYMHFFIEHNRGHHKNVSTEDDPATSRYNEMVYTFWFRSVSGSYISAWKLEAFRLNRLGKKWYHFSNEMIHYTLIQLALLSVIFFTTNIKTLGLYLVASIIGFLLLETVNYIEHYGLKRKKGTHGFKKVLPIHSWNSNHSLGRGILFELSRHSDHHFRANRKYQILRYHDDTPQMPTGYPGMMLLSLVPPVWFKVMNKKVKKLQEEYSNELAA